MSEPNHENTKPRFKVLALLALTDDCFLADVIEQPNRFAQEALGKLEHTNVDAKEIAYVAIPARMWNKYQTYLDEKGLRAEMREYLGPHWTLLIPNNSVKKFENDHDR